MELVDPQDKFGTCFFKRDVTVKGGVKLCCGASPVGISKTKGYCALLAEGTHRIKCSQCLQFKPKN